MTAMATPGPKNPTGRAMARVGRHAGRGGLRGWVLLVALVVLAVTGAAFVDGNDSGAVDRSEQGESPAPGSGAVPDPDRMFRAFKADSWWNTPLPNQTPLHPHADEILDYLRSAPQSGKGCLMLAGAGNSHWGTPLYWTTPADPVYDIRGVKHDRPPELAELRIPESARPAANSDGTMSIYDLEKGYVVALTNAHYHPADDTWSASGATVTYLDSNGLNVKTGRSDDPRNVGSHRGNNGATMAVSWDQADKGEIRHVLKIAVGPEMADRHIFPMVGSDGDYEGDDPGVPPQGLRMRIKASLQLDQFGLEKQALVIARALQRYGLYMGDSGGTTALKLENTRAEGRGQLWNLEADDLCGLPFTDEFWDVVAEDYDPTR